MNPMDNPMAISVTILPAILVALPIIFPIGVSLAIRIDFYANISFGVDAGIILLCSLSQLSYTMVSELISIILAAFGVSFQDDSGSVFVLVFGILRKLDFGYPYNGNQVRCLCNVVENRIN